MRRAAPGMAGPAGPRIVLLLVLAVAAVLPATAAAATPESRPPRLDAATWLLVDLKDQAELAAHGASRRRAIASTTKLMTAYIAMSELKMSDELVVPRYDAAPAESVAGLTPGERLTVHDLIVAMMLPSANDAAVTVAEGVAGSQRAFVREMNSTATDLDLGDTHYSNPIGLDEKGNHSTAADLTVLAQDLLADKRFRRIVAMPTARLESGSQTRTVENTNTLLGTDPSVDGVKTGHTLDAGYVLVASAKRRGVPLLAAVLGASSEAARDAETERLLDYGFSLYDRERPVRRDGGEASVSVRYEDEPLELVAKRGVGVEVREDQRVRVDAEGPEQIEGPVAAGERLGQATVTVDGRFIDRVPLVAARAVAAPSIIDRAGGPLVVALIAGAAIVILAFVLFLLRRRSGGGAGGGRDPEERMRTRQERIRRRGGGQA
ncbi:MAG: D-alanyl-D-alanine carboxypeptidase family protein [Solirubrobacterales bacterium]